MQKVSLCYKAIHFCLRYAILAGLLCSAVRSQSIPQINAGNATGTVPYNSYGGVQESINYSTGNLRLEVPLVSLPGRNGHNIDLSLQYNSKIWNLFHFSPAAPYNYYWRAEVPIPSIVSGGTGGIGWRLNLPVLQAVPYVPFSNEPLLYCYSHFIITLSDGSKHSLANRVQCFQNDGSASANPTYGPVPADNINVTDSDDATFLRLDSTSPTDYKLLTKDGTTIHFTIPATMSGSTFTTIASKIEDTNGNTINIASTDASHGNQVTSVTDTVGRIINFNWGTTGQLLSLSYKDSNGSPQTISAAYTSVTVAPTFSTPNPAQGAGSSASSLISTLTLPNALSYTFQYNTFGEVTKISYPTGGYTRYDYSAYQTNWQFFDGNGGASKPADSRQLTARHVCPSATGSCATENTTTYTPTVDGTMTSNAYLDVRDPLGNRIRHSFGFTIPGCCTSLFSSRETLTYFYSGETTLLKTVQTDYADMPSDWALPIRITTTLNDSGQVTKTEASYDTIVLFAQHQGTIFPSSFTRNIDNIVSESQYAYGAGSPGALLRQTVNTWLKLNPINSQDYTSNAIHILNRPATSQIKDSAGNIRAQTQYEYDSYTAGLTASGAVQHDSTYSLTYKTRGNLTAIMSWRNTDGVWLASRDQYDDAGNVTSTVDPLNHATNFSYADSWGNSTCLPTGGNAAAYLTKVTNPLAQTVTTSINSCSGTIASTKDPNGQMTTISYDLMNRPIQTVLPDGGQTNACYSDVVGSNCYNASFPLNITTTQKINISLSKTTKAIIDGVGRAVQFQLTSDPQGTIYTDTAYDSLGRVSTTSNPYRSGADVTTSAGTKSYGYDALSRRISVTYPDGSVSATAYCGASTLATDPTGKWRRSISDALGRIAEVDEPNAIGAGVASTGCPGSGEPIWATVYTFDILGNLTAVVQNGSHQRSFTYDSLSHLLTSNNPESGNITYSYNDDGILISKTDARGITVNYSPTASPIDVLHRVTQITYSNGDPTITYSYDQPNCLGLSACQNVGHRTGMTDGAGSEAWSFQVDSSSHRSVHVDQRTTNSSPANITKTSTYFLDLSGNVTQAIYPTGRVVNYAYDAADRPISAADSTNGITYATGLQTSPGTSCLSNITCYTPQGTFYALSVGQTASFGGINITHSYNSRLQPSELKASSIGGTAIDLTYNFIDPATSKNAGHVYSVINNLDSTRSQTFVYDQVSRLTSSSTSSTHTTSPTHCWGETYQYDGVTNGAWANLTQIAATTDPAYVGCSQESGFSKTADGSNRLSGLTYDLSGNTLADGINTYAWDAESQLKSGGGLNYLYDGDGHRVAKAGNKLYWYGFGGKVIAETDAAGNTLNEYIFFGGQRVATVPVGGLSNSGFEQGSSGWSLSAGAVPVTDATRAHSGSGYMQLSSAGPQIVAMNAFVPVTPGQLVTF
ncbi:MAG TPA: hypothetical protein VGI16_07980, partial [Candidatus Acidoferrum sp.]